MSLSNTPSETVEFCFRIWVMGSDDPPTVETWYQGLERSNGRYVSDWAREYLDNEDFYKLFELEKGKWYQIIGKATLRGWFDYWGEYDEEMDLISYEKCEVNDPELINNHLKESQIRKKTVNRINREED